jgi:capsular exopolysaccharide synthesis family protein
MNNQSKDFQTSTTSNIDVKKYLYKILGYWKLFLVTIIIGLIVAKFMNAYQEKIYSLDTIISVKEENNPLFSTGTNIAFNWGGSSNEMETVKVILKSRTHNEIVVKRLNFYINYFQEGRFRIEDKYGYTPFIVSLNTSKLQLYNKLIGIEITGDDTFVVSFDFNELGSNSLINYDTNGTANLPSKELSFSKEFNIKDVVSTPFFNFSLRQISPFKIGEKYFIQFTSFDKTVAENRNINVNSISSGGSMLRLQKKGINKKRIEDYLNTTVKVLDSLKQIQKIEFAVKTQAYIDTLFNAVEKRLKEVEKNLGEYKESNNIFNLSSQGSEIFSETIALEKEKNELSSTAEYLSNLKNYLSTKNNFNKDYLVPATIGVQDPKMAGLINNLMTKSSFRESLRNIVKDNHPDIIQISREIQIVKNNLFENISSLQEVNNNRFKRLEAILEVYKTKRSKLPKKEQGLINFQRDYQLSEANYNYLKQKRYEAGTAIAANVSDVKIIDTAKDLGQGPNYPLPSFNYFIAIMLGTVVPLFYIIIKELLDNKIHTVEEIESNYAIPVLGVVGKNKSTNNLAVFERPKSSISESFRTLRSNLQFLFKNTNEDESKTLIVTSSVSGEGKTMVAINMATVFALSGKKTILLGLDLRKPKIYDDFDLSNDAGVVNYLIKQKTLKEVIIKTKIPNLDLILSGPIPPNPSELLLNNSADEMIKHLKKEYDNVIIDTPPVGLVSDALELFQYSDAVIYVVRHDYTEKYMMKMIDDKYKNGEVKNISYVLNDFTVKSKYGYGYGYGYGKYSYGYHENEEPTGFFSKLVGLFKPKK